MTTSKTAELCSRLSSTKTDEYRNYDFIAIFGRIGIDFRLVLSSDC